MPAENIVERNISLPWAMRPEVTWLQYRCWIETYLDAGIALHKPLPQGPQGASRPQRGARLVNNELQCDTLASLDVASATLDQSTQGVSLVSGGDYTDVLQRMATSTYRFCLKGFALRVGYQIPIPGIVKVAGVDATPAERQFATQVVVGNFSGIPLFQARWELWYYVAMPPRAEQLAPPALSDHIRADVQLPPYGKVQVPYTQAGNTNRVPSGSEDDLSPPPQRGGTPAPGTQSGQLYQRIGLLRKRR